MLMKFTNSAEVPVNKGADEMAVLLTLVNILHCYLLLTLSSLKFILTNCCHAFEINLFRAKAARGDVI